ncbi:acyltransferase family protein [Pseudoxanthomonas mexicana]
MSPEALLSRDENNFNLIRVVAAFCVLISHSYTLATGDSQQEPFRLSMGSSLGTLSVDVFFLISGFLVSASAHRRSVYHYLRSRFLRVYPALLVMLGVTVLCLCGYITSLSYSAYVSDPVTVTYLFQNSILLTGVSYYLPGVFEGNPYPLAVNGPLWTLVVEVRLYLLLGALFWVLSHFAIIRQRAEKWVVLMMAAGSLALLLHAHFISGASTYWFRLYTMFWFGAALFCWRESIQISTALVIASVCILLLAVLFAPARYFLPSWVIAMPILVMWGAALSLSWLRRYNQVGDYSYGIYIYAFPIQQTIVWALGGVSPEALIVLTAIFTIPLAVASWHFIEKPTLARKG